MLFSSECCFYGFNYTLLLLLLLLLDIFRFPLLLERRERNVLPANGAIILWTSTSKQFCCPSRGDLRWDQLSRVWIRLLLASLLRVVSCDGSIFSVTAYCTSPKHRGKSERRLRSCTSCEEIRHCRRNFCAQESSWTFLLYCIVLCRPSLLRGINWTLGVGIKCWKWDHNSVNIFESEW